MKYFRVTQGLPSKPLLIAYHGAMQFSTGLVSEIPWYFSFPHMSKLIQTCEELKWSCYMPQAPLTLWREKHIKKRKWLPRTRTPQWEPDAPLKIITHVNTARILTNSLGPLILFGFSAGQVMAGEGADTLVEKADHPRDVPVGIWLHSCLAPDDFPTSGEYKVVVSCNESETKPLPLNGGRSMQDERLLAYDWYQKRGFRVSTLEGTARGHRCDPSLNKDVLSSLV